MDHLPFLFDRQVDAAGSGVGEPTGHALMASCPPHPFSELGPTVPFGYTHVPGVPTVAASGLADDTLATAATDASHHDGRDQRTWEVPRADLATLLNLSQHLDLDGEITPVMAWGMIVGHPRAGELTLEDFVKLTEELARKARCYG